MCLVMLKPLRTHEANAADQAARTVTLRSMRVASEARPRNVTLRLMRVAC